MEFLFLAIKSLYTRKSSLRVGRDVLRPLDCEIGVKQPHLQRLESAVKCSECGTQFSILKHKHNCRFCGAVSLYLDTTQLILLSCLPQLIIVCNCRCSVPSALTTASRCPGRRGGRLASAAAATRC